MSTDNRARILKIIGDQLEADQIDGVFTEESTFADLGVESLTVVEIIFALEEAFDIEIPDPGQGEESDRNFQTVGDVIALVEGLIDNKG